MRLLTFQARRFAWKSFSRTLDDGSADPLSEPVADELPDAVVAFVHAEARDEGPDERARVLRHAHKHVKWLANKRGLRNVVLHSFTHLGATNAAPAFARDLLVELGERLRANGYEVRATPFGWFCEWELAVHGDSLAKVWKEI